MKLIADTLISFYETAVPLGAIAIGILRRRPHHPQLPEIKPMKSLIDAAVRARQHAEDDDTVMLAPTRAALRQLVDFVLAACPPPPDTKSLAPRGQHVIYTHPNYRRALTFEPGDPWTPYYEWVRSPGEISGWRLVNRHAWKDEALAVVGGEITAPHTSRPPPSSERPGPGPCSIEVMPLEEQIRQVLAAAKDRDLFHGLEMEAITALEAEGFNLEDDNVKDALWRVTRGTTYPGSPSEQTL